MASPERLSLTTLVTDLKSGRKEENIGVVLQRRPHFLSEGAVRTLEVESKRPNADVTIFCRPILQR